MTLKIRSPKTFCTTREAADILGISLRTAQLWSEKGLMEVWKTSGGHRRITRVSIERLLAVSPAPDAAQPLAAQPVLPVVPKRRVDDVLLKTVKGMALNVLIVEDDPSLRRLYKIKLGRWPIQTNVSTSDDGYEALLRIGHEMPDLLIADLQMEGMDGFRMINTIRSVQALAGMNIVVVSGLDSEEISRRGGLPDGIPILPKPIPFEQLHAFAEEVAIKKLKLVR